MKSLASFKCRVLAVSLLIVAVVCAPFADAAPKVKPADPIDNSDLNNDYQVDYADLVIFSTDYLGQSVETVDWCDFYNDVYYLPDDLYGHTPDWYQKHFSQLLDFINTAYCQLSDMNGDQVINVRDLLAFSEEFANEHFMLVDWCVFLQSVLDGNPYFNHPALFYLDHYGDLVLYIQDKYTCTDEPPPPDGLNLKNEPRSLTRIAAARNLTGDYYVTDAKVGSVFIYDSNLVLTGELKGLARPLGIAVNALGQILVGNDKRNNIEVYDPDTGQKLATFGETEIETPSSIMIDAQGRVYVTDAGSNTVYVFDSAYNLLASIGKPGRDASQLRGPSSALLLADESELFVLDRLNKRVQVYDPDNIDPDSNWLRGFGFAGTPDQNCNWFTGVCAIPGAPAFTRIQAMDLDAAGRLHVLDVFHAVINVFNPQTGVFLTKYGTYGLNTGQLKSPVDLLVESNRVLVVDGGKNTIEVLALP